ncbi:Der GTPase-activating protein YihI [Rouxiella badensis]|jgi:ribosome assembly protein YihI (activator of Der GTPase)|uniref:Der GTPase-activating protein YihI n=1 Tax=Rouxiella badensis TaxID=1646377 RepID=A0A1X0W9I5_9GAMM|nr:Der GTPase-activating protein YihI [Rouxiella badensis]MCC3704284.1 Der GTPase-activating protein YihI [Rouxiella badensis]MCC3720817.1 Der GTPase-activating protein YihI [Rouxiella badensis]MCC3730656.1 Der GTPase-activating protein YihI [Rouxiella badensis]MCC3734849.1 Der GTPase-activating protein YihI [Rouxiella badensis]MCC3741846.1 Der GTPase-activating protein YihI [Rouxiella badensis]
MNQSAKAPRAKAATSKTKKKSRVELDIEARERKRDNKRRGHKPGTRANPDAEKNQSANSGKKTDPRIGSKKPVPLVVETVFNNSPKAKKPAKPKQEAKPALPPEEELTLLENDARLDSLLDLLDEGKTLSAEDQSYVDQTLDRIDVLMEQLGIELGDEDDEDEEQGENMYRLLKGGN